MPAGDGPVDVLAVAHPTGCEDLAEERRASPRQRLPGRRPPEGAKATPHLETAALPLALGRHQPRIGRQLGKATEDALDRALWLRINVDRVNVHALAGVRDPEHDVITVEQLPDGRLDRQTPVVAAPVGKRRQNRRQRAIEPFDIHLSQRQTHGVRPPRMGRIVRCEDRTALTS